MRNHRNIVVIALLGALACVACWALALLAVISTPRLAAPLLGLEHIGPLESAPLSSPPPMTLEGTSLDHVDLLLPPHLTEPLRLTAEDMDGRAIIGNTSTPGTSVYLLTLDESNLNHLLHHILPDGISRERYRDLEIKLRPGGLILYADVKLGLRWQRMGLLLRGEAGKVTLTPVGLVLDQEVYAAPENGFLSRTASSARARAEHLLKTLTIQGPLPGEAHVTQMNLGTDGLQMRAEATYDVPPPPDTGWQPLTTGVDLREMDVDINADTHNLTERVHIVRLDPAQVRFRVRYDPDHPRTVSAWSRETQALLTVNAGYFTPEGEATALLVSGGEKAGAHLGNFAGMFAVTADDQVSVRWMRERPYDPAEPLAEAVQSFPVLVKPGGVMGFPEDADDGALSRRTVVAQDRAGRILFVIAPRGTLSLHEAATFLAESDLQIDVALNLDGGGSTGLWMKAGERSIQINSLTPVPSVITVEPR